jgi:ABC-2 type transport system ATP-binding protein
MKTLLIKALNKRFKDLWAVKDLNLELSAGEIFVLLGPNGAGKTTTLKLIAGLLHPDSGSISVGGFDITRDPIRAKSLLGYIPDEPFIYSKLTGREFINFVAGLYGFNKEDYEEQLEGLFERFEIGSWIDEFSEGYSHGMKQKVIMCQLLIHDPVLILIDEPLVGLDPKVSKVVRETFFELREAGRTLFVCTHTLSFAREIASRIGIVNHGELKFVGGLEELSKQAGVKDIEEIYLKLSEG